jgi:hypothetical protein
MAPTRGHEARVVPTRRHRPSSGQRPPADAPPPAALVALIHARSVPTSAPRPIEHPRHEGTAASGRLPGCGSSPLAGGAAEQADRIERGRVAANGRRRGVRLAPVTAARAGSPTGIPSAAPRRCPLVARPRAEAPRGAADQFGPPRTARSPVGCDGPQAHPPRRRGTPTRFEWIQVFYGQQRRHSTHRHTGPPPATPRPSDAVRSDHHHRTRTVRRPRNAIPGSLQPVGGDTIRSAACRTFGVGARGGDGVSDPGLVRGPRIGRGR